MNKKHSPHTGYQPSGEIDECYPTGMAYVGRRSKRISAKGRRIWAVCRARPCPFAPTHPAVQRSPPLEAVFRICGPQASMGHAPMREGTRSF